VWTNIQHCLVFYNAEFASEGSDLFPRLKLCTPGLRLSPGGRRGYWPVHSYLLSNHWNLCLFEDRAHKTVPKADGI
jgi:hypothetical protein